MRRYDCKCFFIIWLLVLGAVTISQAQVFTTLVVFNGPDGGQPGYGSLVQNIDGNLYGTTASEGPHSPLNAGTVFRMTPSGALTTIYGFCLLVDCTDGFAPDGLVLSTDGNFYGTTSGGGTGVYCVVPNACGTMFKITPAGSLTTLYDFCSMPNCVDGQGPEATLLRGSDGNFYGTASDAGALGAGTVFRVTSSGKFTLLHTFKYSDGSNPFGPLLEANNGTIYGTTSAGGDATFRCLGGCGTIYTIDPSGKFSTLHFFQGSDGSSALSGLIQGSDGNFYGTTELGGNHTCFPPFGCGTIFKITPDGTLTTLHEFNDIADGITPFGTLVRGTDGNFYGTTYEGGTSSNCGSHGCGTIFRVTPSGDFTVLHSFDQADGANPRSQLIQDTSGLFYGLTGEGGDLNCNPSEGCGTIYSLDMGLGPFVSLVNHSGKVGQQVGILGQALTGTSSVSFNGVVANFTVKSDTLVIATVPTGATTGLVAVTTSSGTLNSNVPFVIIP